MGLFKGFFRNIARPYSNAIKGLADSGKKIKDDVEVIANSVKKPKEEKRWVQAPDAKSAFELLFKENDWTEEDLQKQKQMVRRSKWLMLGFAWLALLGVVFFATNFVLSVMADEGFLFYMYLTMASFFVFVLFFLTAVKQAIFQEQIEQRTLLNLKEFLSTGQYIRKLFQ